MEQASVLIVDDHTLVAHGIERILRQCRGIKVVAVATSGDAALQAVEAHHPSLMLLDVHLGDRCGLPLVERAKQLAPGLRVVMLSAYANPEFVLEALLLGVDGYLEKNERPAELRGAVQRAARGEVVFSESVAAVARALGFEVASDLPRAPAADTRRGGATRPVATEAGGRAG